MTEPVNVLLVTGASRGIGAATARLAAARGFSVGVNYLGNRTAAERVAAEIESSGAKAIAVRADVGEEAEVAKLFETVDRELGPVTALVNNAGINGGYSRVDEVDGARLTQVFATNVFGTFFCAREAVRRMSTAHGGPGGAIVNVSSQAATFGGNKLAHYAASKAAVNALTIGLAREVAGEGIRVNAVSPGVIETDALDGLDAGRLEGLKASLPMERFGGPEEVADTILWLLSDQASYVTGAILPVAGGR